MRLPDITGPKVLYATILFAASTFFPSQSLTFTFIFGILYYLSLRYLGHVKFTNADLAIPTALFYFVPHSTTGLFIFLAIVSIYRMLIPNV